MDQALQENFRKEVGEKWLCQAWELLCQSDLLAGELADLNNRRNDLVKLKGDLEEERVKIVALPDAHTKENRDRVKSLKDTMNGLDQNIERFDTMMKNDTKNLTENRIKAMRYLKCAKHAETYVYQAPPEAKDAPPIDAISAEAAGQQDGAPVIPAKV